MTRSVQLRQWSTGRSAAAMLIGTSGVILAILLFPREPGVPAQSRPASSEVAAERPMPAPRDDAALAGNVDALTELIRRGLPVERSLPLLLESNEDVSLVLATLDGEMPGRWFAHLVESRTPDEYERVFDQIVDLFVFSAARPSFSPDEISAAARGAALLVGVAIELSMASGGPASGDPSDMLRYAAETLDSLPRASAVAEADRAWDRIGELAVDTGVLDRPGLSNYAVLLKYRLHHLVDRAQVEAFRDVAAEWQRVDWPRRDANRQWRAGYIAKLTRQINSRAAP